jgi:Na+-transporting NADH:ubiquinone oxidoreductase subunit A
MSLHKAKSGLRLPISGAPSRDVERPRSAKYVALLADDYLGLRPAMQVSVGDDVKRGQVLFEDKKRPGVRHTAPAAGTVRAVHRGDRRALRSVVIEMSPAEMAGRSPAEASFRSFSGRHPTGLTPDEVVELLTESGLWTSLRERPYGHVATPATRPHSIFVTAVDTHPLAPPLDLVVQDKAAPFERGLAALTRLTDGPVFVCTGPETPLPIPTLDRVRHEQFSGPHPSGTPGWHIHRLDPVDRQKTVWHIGVQDVVAIGGLFETGSLDVRRIVAVGGPPVRRPRLLETRLGVSIDELLSDELEDVDARQISGSVLSGRAASGAVEGYLGRYHQQISVLREGREREFLGWLGPGLDKFSVIPTFVSRLLPGRPMRFTTTSNGSKRAIVPIGMFEKVLPFDILPTPLLRSLLMGDVERAEELGCLELDEEDVAVCTFVCSGKNDYGPLLRHVLDTIEGEG